MEERGSRLSRIGASSVEWDLRAIQSLLWRRRWLVLAVAAQVFLVTALVTFLRTPLYEASARVLIERSTPKVLEGEDVVPKVWGEYEVARFYATQYLLLKDPRVIGHALDDPEFRIREQLLASFEANRADENAPLPGDDDLARFIRGNISVEQKEYSNMVEVSFRHPSPTVAADVVNAVTNAYQDFFVQEIGLAPRKRASQFLREAIDDSTAEVLELEKRLEEQTRQSNTAVAASESDMGRSRLEKLDAMLTDAKARLVQAEARLRAYQNATPDGLEQVHSDPRVQKYRSELAQLQREIAEFSGKVGSSWPRVRELRTAISEVKQDLERQQREVYKEVLATARADLAMAREDRERLERLYEKERKRANRLQYNARDVEKLRREYAQKKANLERLLGRWEEVALSTDLQEILRRQVSVIGPATPPEHPAVPRVFFNLALGMMFGGFLGVGSAFLAEALDNKVRNAQQLADIAELPLLGSIPKLEGTPRPKLVFSRRRADTTPAIVDRQHHEVEESFRAIRSALLLAQIDRPPRSLLVTSAVPGEGKSTIVANLGRTLASFGSRTLLIDADLRHPRLHRVFNVTKQRGLTNLLASGVPPEEVIFATEHDNLWVMPGGPSPPDPATLLDSDRMLELFGGLYEHFDFVIVDTPPVLVFSDCYSIVPAVESLVFAARAMTTQKDAVRQALDGLRKMKAPLAGVVLNGETASQQGRGYSYYRYYHYRKGYYRRARDERERDERERDAAGGAG
jgi:capsular exopolysaccharide synthesis family protein